MSRSHQSALRPPISFAHRGASALERENTMPAFELALRLGASGLESDVWLTSDGVPVLDHDGVTGGRFRRKPISAVPRDSLEAHIPTLAEFYSTLGVDFELSLDIKDDRAIEPVLDLARTYEQSTGESVVSRLWLCHPDWEKLARWRTRYPDARLVNSTGLKRMPQGPERLASQLAAAGIDA
ncbi:MAG: glycerophosphodiester phosphodiesterase, partial [Acidimicrobiales bacterium]